MLNNFWPRLKAAWTTFRDWESPEARQARITAFMMERERQRDDTLRFALENAEPAHRQKILHFVGGLAATSKPATEDVKVFIASVESLSVDSQVLVLKAAIGRCNGLILSPALQGWIVQKPQLIRALNTKQRAA